VSNAQLPERPSIEFLKKLAKDRLQVLRRSDPAAKLAEALLDVARDHGFSSWRALKEHVEERQRERVAEFVEACRSGAFDAVQKLLLADRELARSPDAHESTALHAAAARGHRDVVQLLLQHDADPNARDAGDNATPLHFAAGGGHVDVVRALLDAGADVHGYGDVHESEVIGWATALAGPNDVRWNVLPVLLERGAWHHIFSAIATGDLGLIRRLAEDNPEALDRRLSRFEHGQTPLHFAISRQRHDVLDLLIELGADLEARDLSGRTALEIAMTRGDKDATRRLSNAGASAPPVQSAVDFTARMAALSKSVAKGVPMIYVPDVARALDWYVSIGFKALNRFDADGVVNFGMVAFGNAELMLNMQGKPGPHDVSLWFYSDQVDALYEVLKSRRIATARAELAGIASDDAGIEFEQDIEDMFYGARQFCIRDLNRYQLYFIGDRDSRATRLTAAMR
jgi:ankyrin repeat protein